MYQAQAFMILSRSTLGVMPSFVKILVQKLSINDPTLLGGKKRTSKVPHVCMYVCMSTSLLLQPICLVPYWYRNNWAAVTFPKLQDPKYMLIKCIYFSVT